MSIQAVVSALGGKMGANYAMVRCPVHTDRTPSLKITEIGGDIRLHCFAGCDWRTVKDELAQRGLMPAYEGIASHAPYETGEERVARRKRDEREDAQKLQWCRSIWNASESAKNSPVEAYLTSRGIDVMPPLIRCHGNLKHTGTGQSFPAMIAAVSRYPDNEITGIHRTYLQSDGSGKAKISSAKMMAGKCRGGAVQLVPCSNQLALTEGIETALSVLQATNIPTWACLSTGGLTGVVVPETVTEILIFADHDEPGIRAANYASDRFRNEGRSARIVLPPEPGTDFNDMIKEFEA
ncbi:MAG: toprim domain-containing protein [Bacteroidetes bacterium]|nr:toprim domain-containing protein [Bacteroidota bacterium]